MFSIVPECSWCIQPHHPDPHPPYPRSIIELQYVFDIYWTENDAERSSSTAHPKQAPERSLMSSAVGPSVICNFRVSIGQRIGDDRSVSGPLSATLIDWLCTKQFRLHILTEIFESVPCPGEPVSPEQRLAIKYT